MNLNAIVGPVCASINDWVIAYMQQSQGYTTDGDGSRVPAYGPMTPMQVQLQALQYNDLMQVNGLNITGIRHAMYINGAWEPVVRSQREGGDLVTLPDGSVWLIVFLFENWNRTGGWSKVCITLQNGS
ncbi:hypothetical protein [Paraburkholderia sp. RL18-085-BIA-A]|uniref:hypothetical protein n=1 Tax=Paraburkholderia sp. RL18-085-BIA-A TaxID=3031633 RepID=UPI0038BDDC5D